MRLLRPILSILTILLFFSNFGISQNQSSIYQDAKTLAELIREKQTPLLDLSKIFIDVDLDESSFEIRNGTKKIETTKLDRFDEDVKIPTLSLSTVGTYNIKLGVKDTLQIFIQDSLIQINGDTLLHLVKINFQLEKILVSRLDSIENDASKFQTTMLFESNGDFINMLEILDAHTYLYPLRNIYDYSSIRKIPQEYSKNPFFTSNIKNDLLLDEGTTRHFLSDDYFDKKRTLVNYDWHKLMYGDSTLKFDKTVSLQDVSSSYRAPITSKNELEIANTQINKTSREQGFLDAKTIAVGLSDFIAERAQEELNLTFFNRFKENLKDSSELTILFPNTRDLLYKFEISNYKTLLSHARESFTVDLDNLGLNFPKILELDKYQELNNSPEVYNLALIYSITDLAYRDVPVENIMFAGFKKLKQRKIELAKSIDEQLADRILFPKIEKKDSKKSKKKKAKKINPNLPKIIKGRELSTLNTLTLSYLDAVKNYQKDFRQQVSQLGENMNFHKSADEITFKIKSDSLKFEGFLEHLEVKLDNQLEEASPQLVDYDTRTLKYQNRKVPDYIIDFYKKTISANLDKREHFEYLTLQPSMEEYVDVFESTPKSKKELVAQGISGTRNLINENFDITLEEKFNKLKTTANEVRTIKGNLLQIEKSNESIVTKIDTLIIQTESLKTIINFEIQFWKTALDSNLNNYPHHNISALKYLRTLLDNDYYLATFRQLSVISKDSTYFHSVINQDYSNTIGDDFQGSMDIAYSRLDSVLRKFETKVRQLAKEFGQQKISSKVLSIKNASHLKHKEHQILKQQWAQNSITYQKNLNAIDLKYWKLENQNEALENLKNQSFDLSDQQENIAGQAQAEGRIMSAADSIKINQLDNEKEIISAKINTIIQQIKEKRKQELTIIQNDYFAEDTRLTELIDKFKNGLFASSTSIVTNDSLTTIGQGYDFSKNRLVQNFQERKARLTMIDSAHFEDLNIFDHRLKKISKDLDHIKQSKKELNNYLLALENEYCKNLVDAKENARNLSKGLEFSIHLLLAFRDYKKIHTPITVSDTTRIVLTKNKIDPQKGFILGTSTLDSLDIKNEPIKELNVDTTIARWISLEDFSKMRNDPIEWNLFLGLLYQRLSIIEDAPNFSASGTALLATKFFSITNDMEGYRQQLRIKKADQSQEITFRDYYPFIRSTVDLFNTVITTPSIGTESLEQKYPSLASVPQISNEALSLYENIYVKEYGNAILNAMQLLRLITKRKSTDSANDKKEKKELRRSNRNINAVLTYGTFMADMVKAKTSDQVKNILKSATLPPGSSRIKRETVSSFTINSYLGAGAGNDHLLNVPDGLNLDKDALGASLFVPIGFTYSFSPNWWKPKGSFSVHVPLIDLGAITAFRQNPDNPNFNIDALPDFSWSNLFSPGAFIAYNVNNSPFTFGVGGIYGPQLRQIKFDTGEAVNVNSWRFPMGFITIDVPFFNLHTGARKIEIE